ncbi:MAG: methyltransferase domain-containing protein [Candidatus Marinimicrobia bacterium]|nr:methyltransferase domain-containing protein [Candidatus Neomarinimicrobiota bacterium]
MTSYVHGYSERESARLHDQADSVRDLLHHDTRYPAGNLVLEMGCGIGAQTVTLARNSPDAAIVAVDISGDSLHQAEAFIHRQGLSNVQFRQADVFDLPYEEEYFDDIFVCHVLEHLQQPAEALTKLRTVLKTGGSITVIEGDHGSCTFRPESKEARQVWRCLIDVQARLGGNALIGRGLFPLLSRAQFDVVHVSPRMVYIDHSNPRLMDRFVNRTIIPMVEGVRARVMDWGLMDQISWERGINDLYQVANGDDSTFCYTFYKATGIK